MSALRLINEFSATSVTSLSATDVFSADFDIYKITTTEWNNPSANTDMNIRLILLLIVFFLPSPQSNGQISDLSLLGLDTNEFLNSTSTQDEVEEFERLEDENAKIIEQKAEEESSKDFRNHSI